MIASADPGSEWHCVVDREVPLAQGDQLWGVEYVQPHAQPDGTWIAQKVAEDVVILTQACDIQSKQGFVILTAPIHSVYDWVVYTPGDLDRLEAIRKGHDLSLFLLPRLVDSRIPQARDDRIVDFANVVTIPLERLLLAAEQRPRLAMRPPTRELLAQAYAHSIMRVALETEIPSYKMHGAPNTTRNECEVLSLPQGSISGFDQPQTLRKPLSATRSVKERRTTDDRFIVLRVSLGTGSQLRGVGRGDNEAIQSLARNFRILRDRYLDEGDERYRPLVDDYLPELDGNS
ncbi:MAG TPA: hypothetical protein VMW80_00065 [Candidatus Dormibacteraeota bacterium]|nr:hypothetical protein [Candidatus Dormibacteraeota bacterium]